MQPTVYGFASSEEVEKLIRARLNNTPFDDNAAMDKLAGQAVFALLEINNSIPVHAKQRHLVASALENFAEGK